jgi:enoyl-CoA hydratase/carnithine racemase
MCICDTRRRVQARAVAADILLAAPNTKFSQPKVNTGTITGGGNSHAMELVLTGHMWSAQEAAARGMASRVVREGEGKEDGTTVVKEAVALAGLRGVAVIVPRSSSSRRHILVATSSPHHHHRATIVVVGSCAVVGPGGGGRLCIHRR